MWSTIASYIPKWSVFFQAILLFLVPILFITCSTWLKQGLKSRFALDKSDPTSPKQKEHAQLENFQKSYDANVKLVEKVLSLNGDVKYREFQIKGTDTLVKLVYVNGLLDVDLLDTHVITPMMLKGVSEGEKEQFLQCSDSMEQYLYHRLLPASELKTTQRLDEFISSVLYGSIGMLMDGVDVAFMIGSAKGKSRSVEDPLSEALLRGPRVGFTERITENTGLLRMHGQNESLTLRNFEIGNRVRKELVVAYMHDIADANLVDEVIHRIEQINIDDPMESGYIEQLIEDNYLSPFQQLQNTERPDRVIAGLLEGRVAILLDGTPFALILPVTFSMLLQSPEDYYERWLPGSFFRILRFVAAFLALFAPALYISFISFHPGLIPTKLALNIMETRQGVPFPSIIEALIMESAIEVLREAGIRLPKPIGPAMGIVGGLIIGDAAVNAGIVSPFLVIVVAITAISSFTIPMYSAGITLRILRFAAMISASVLGLYGVVMFFLMICCHLVRLKSFGVPYVSPMVPYKISDWKDFMIRAPLKMMKKRPYMFNPNDPDRRK